jgi:putative FmdB family regulatory protein
MPMYEYECRAHGVFEAMRSMHEAALPDRCPSCGRHAARILSAPRLAQMVRSEVVARDRNERSRHEPKLVQGPSAFGADTPKRGAATRAREPGQRPALRASPGLRPWVLEHH